MKVTNNFKKYALGAVIFAGLTTASCDNDDDVAPKFENDLEVITDVELIFTNTKDSNDVVKALAQDPDGPGAKSVEIKNAINLDKNKEYKLTFEILNKLAEKEDDHDDHDDHDDDHKDDHDDHDHGYNVGEEVKEEDDQHQLFFSFTKDAFLNPLGDGNIDNSKDPIQYQDKDKNGLPVGLETLWNTKNKDLNNGFFTVYLKHQPGVKSATSTSNDGDTDFKLKFKLNIK